MADNTQLNRASSVGDVIASDDIGGVKHQRVKVQHGNDGEAKDTSYDNPLPVYFGDTPQLDAFGRVRVSNPSTIFTSKNIHSRHREKWEEALSGLVVVHGTVTGGPFQVGESVTFSPGASGATSGTITSVNAGSVVLDIINEDIVVGDTMTGGTSGATAAVTTTNTGSTIAHQPDSASVLLTCGTGANDYAVRQSVRYIPYIPGKGQNPVLTFIMGAAVTNVVRRAGLFDDNNGIFIEQTDSDVALVIRSSTSGSVVNTRIVQSDATTPWNNDNLDGNGDSGVTLDLSKMQIMGIDFQWLGGGDVRLTFDIEKAIEAHTQHHANDVTLPYMATASLPVRYEIRNSAATESTNTMTEVCCAISSEGGFNPPGYEFSTPISWSNERGITTRTPILAIRLKSQYSTAVTTNRVTAQLRDSGFFARTQDALFEVVHVHDPFNITATWNSVGDDSGIEYSTDISAVSGRHEHIIDSTFGSTGIASSGSTQAIDPTVFNEHAFINQNYDSTNSQMFVVFATSRTLTSNVTAHLTWTEFE